MEAGQGEAGRRMVKGRRGPIGGGMARLARLREPGSRVRRIIGAIEIGEVAADAGRVRGGQVVIAIHVALRALQRGVEAGQREPGRRVIERRTAPGRRGVALLAGLREIGLYVTRIRRGVEIVQVAAHASRAGHVVVVVYVAVGAQPRRRHDDPRLGHHPDDHDRLHQPAGRSDQAEADPAAVAPIGPMLPLSARHSCERAAGEILHTPATTSGCSFRSQRSWSGLRWREPT